MSSEHYQRTSTSTASSDEEPDYMSEEFLKQCTQNDVRPSLIHSREVKRKIDVLKRQEERNKTRQEAEKARLKSLEESLKTPVSTENKGFQMMVKMGYKPGSSIGNTNDSSRSGIKEPISIDLKQFRGGLGLKRSEESKRKVEAVMEHGNQEEFRQRKQAASKMRETAADLRKAQFSCQNLDQEAGVEKPLQRWYWQKENIRKDSEKLDHDDLTDSKDSEIPNKKLKVIDATDDDSDDANDDTDSEDDDDDVPDEQKLNSIFAYLRDKYFYCLWCGAKYSGSSDLDANCPGVDKDDH